MKLYIKQKVFSWTDKFSVLDEFGRDRYFIEGELFSWGKKLHIYDTHGREAAFIHQEVWSFLPRYNVSIGGTDVAQVKREFTFFLPKYTIEGPGWEANGSFFAHDYEITGDGRSVAAIRKEWMTWGDSYELSIFDPRDEILALAVVLTIDCVMASDNSN